jgi:hypothetical protein
VAQDGDDGPSVDEVEGFGEVSLEEGGGKVVMAMIIVSTSYIADRIIDPPPFKDGTLVGGEDV